MELYEGICTRRSIRKFTEQQVADETVKELLAAAMFAPSAGNQQPWEFVVINDRQILDSVPEFHPHATLIKGAPMAIAVCADLSREKHPGNWVLDCSAATQNILLAVHAKGLGACWIGIYPKDERVNGVGGLLGLPENVKVLSLIAVGHPAQEPKQPERYLSERVHINKYKGQ